MSNQFIILSILVISAVTIAIRFLPFLLFNKKDPPPVVVYLGKTLPYAAMGMLVVYCLKNVSFSQWNSFLPELISGLLVTISYLWKRNAILSILIGTICYMLLVQLVFI